MVSSPLACAQCGIRASAMSILEYSRGCFWQDLWYCSNVCSHAAGDRTACHGWDCGCTGYAKKRRLLNAHRVQLRIAEDLINANDLMEEYEDAVLEETDTAGVWLEEDPGLDEDSDQEDPEAIAKEELRQLRQEPVDLQSFVTAAQSTLESRRVLTDLERARMQLEDRRSLGLA